MALWSSVKTYIGIIEQASFIRPVEGSTTLVANARALSFLGSYVHFKLPSAYPLNALLATLDKEITLLCCDNIRENGLMLEKCLKQYVEQSKELELLNWIEKKVSFPSCVVDRITPRSPNYLKKEIKEK